MRRRFASLALGVLIALASCPGVAQASVLGQDDGQAPPAASHTLTVKYRFLDFSQAAPPLVKAVAEGADYSEPSPAVAGFVPDIAVVTGTMPAADVTLTVTYHADPAAGPGSGAGAGDTGAGGGSGGTSPGPGADGDPGSNTGAGQGGTGGTGGSGQDGQGGTGGSGQDGQAPGGGEPGTGAPGLPAAGLVSRLFIRDNQAAADDIRHYYGEDWDPAYEHPQISQKGQIVKLNAWYVTDSDPSTMIEAANSATDMGNVAVVWASSDAAVATVSPIGEMIARGNGTVTISATVADASKCPGGVAVAKSVTFVIDGQSGEYVYKVAIIDSEGNPLGTESGGIKEFNEAAVYFDFHALIHWRDAGTGAERVEDTRNGAEAVSAAVRWSIGGSQLPATVNEQTGRLRTTDESGSAYVICSVTGGLGGGIVEDFAKFRLDTGEYAYNPASSLTLRVVYDLLKDENGNPVVVSQHSYSFAELLGSLASYTYSYTVNAATRFGVIHAEGFLFKDVLLLEGIDLDEVYQFRFTTADGYDNPLTYQLLYGSGSRYYFPNWDIGSQAQAQVVPPMLAWRSNFEWNVSEANPAKPMDEGTRFRLVYGPLWSMETNSSHQIYYINAITIVMHGAPPATGGLGPGSGTGAGAGEGQGADGSGSKAGGIGGQGAEPAGGGEAQKPAEAGGLQAAAGLAAAQDDGAAGQAGGGHRIFEMISSSQSQLGGIDFDNPLLAIALPLATADLLLGGLLTFYGFRRRLA
jgi:hypothetical protein